MCIEDPCLNCPRQTKLQLTPEGNKFCKYCKLKAKHEKLWQALNNYTFWEDYIMFNTKIKEHP